MCNLVLSIAVVAAGEELFVLAAKHGGTDAMYGVRASTFPLTREGHASHLVAGLFGIASTTLLAIRALLVLWVLPHV